MLNVNSISMDATSRINEVDVVHFTASVYGANKTYTVTKDIWDKDSYVTNKEQCDADYASFEEKVLELSGE